MDAKKLSRMALMLALALALSYVERFIPLEALIPLPGVKLGLANVVTLWAVYALAPVEALLIILLRCVMGAVFGGGITGLAFSLTGGIFALITMLLSKKSSALSEVGVSVLGAAGHNIGQISAAAALMRTVGVAAYLPALLLVGAVTGTVIGLAAQRVLKAIGVKK